MATYWLTFRIHETGNADARRDALYEAIKTLTSEWWVEPTSFIAFDSASNIDAVAAKAKSAINPNIDLVFIGMTDYKSARLVGDSDDFRTVLKLFPFVKRV
jgi:hypothetical protein